MNGGSTTVAAIAFVASATLACAAAPRRSGTHAAAARPSAADARTRRVDEIFADLEGGPGCAVGVVIAGELAYSRGYGLATLAPQSPIGSATLFDAASITKQLTALLLAMLEAEGKLSLEDDVRKYVPELPDYGAPMRIRHLVHHTSGLREMWPLVQLAGWRTRTDIVTRDDAVRLIVRQRGLEFPPGTRFEYSNTGYVLLAVIAERVSGEAFAEALERRILAPLGMHDSRVQREHGEVVENTAVGYEPQGKGFRVHPSDHLLIDGPGGLQTSVADLAKWSANFRNRKVGGALVDALSRPGKLDDGSTVPYGGGQYLEDDRGMPLVAHGGANAAYTSDLMRYPEEDLAVIVLCNREGADAIARARKVADIYLEGRTKTPRPDPRAPAAAPTSPTAVRTLSEQELDALLGLYYSPELDVVYRIERDDARLMLRMPHRKPDELVATGEDELASAWVRLHITRERQRVSGFRLDQGRVQGLLFTRVVFEQR